MSVEELIAKYKAYQDWIGKRPEWTEADVLELTRHLANGTLGYDRDFGLKEQHRNDDA